jgi:hypothetical protein
MRQFELELEVNGKTRFLSSTLPFTPERVIILKRKIEIEDEIKALEVELEQNRLELLNTQPEWRELQRKKNKGTGGAGTYGLSN